MLSSPRVHSVAALVLSCSTVVLAQQQPVIPTPSDLERKSLELKAVPNLVPPSPVPRKISAPDEDIKLEVIRYELPLNAPADLRKALPKLTEPYLGKDRSFGDIANAAREVTAYLQAELGYYLGIAYIPEQEPRDGVIQIAVLEGRLDDIELVWTEGLPVAREVVESYLRQLAPGSVLLVRDVERLVFLLNDLRGIASTFEVRSGSLPGTAKLVVTVKPTQSTEWRTEFDNANALDLGRNRVSATVVRNSPFNRGDSLSATIMTANKGMTFGMASYTTPVGPNGMRVGAAISKLEYQVVKGNFANSGLEGQASTTAVFGLYPVIRSRNLNVFTTGGVDVKSYEDFNGFFNTNKRVNTVNIGVTGDLRDNLAGGGINSMDAMLVSGQVKQDRTLGTDLPAPRFNKLAVRGVRLQNIVPGVFQGYASVRLQKAFDNLDSTEQFRAGGPDGVRAFFPGEGTGDSGLQATLELRWLIPKQWLADNNIGGDSSIALFTDWATLRKRNDTSTQLPGFINREDYSGAGFAWQWNGPKGLSVRTSIAKQYKAPKNSDGTFRYDRENHFFINVSKQN